MGKIKVVIADKHPLMLNGITTFLSKYPSYIIEETFSDVKSAIEYCLLNNPDVLVLGEFSEGLSGAELICWVSSKLIKSKIIAYIEKSPYINTDTIIEAGAMGIVWRTSQPSKLNQSIDIVFNGGCYLDDDILKLASLARNIGTHNCLTVRERQILQLIADGNTNKHMARILNVSNKTVETHRLNLMKKMDVHNGIELLKVGLRMGVCTI